MMHQPKAVMLLCVFCLSLLSSCNWSTPLEWVYYNRVKFTFWDNDKEDQVVFLCTKEKTSDATRLKAETSNGLYQTGMESIINAFSDNLLKQMRDKSEEEFSIMDGISMSVALQNKTEELIDSIEKKHQCLLIDIIEADENN